MSGHRVGLGHGVLQELGAVEPALEVITIICIIVDEHFGTGCVVDALIWASESDAVCQSVHGC